MLKHKNNKQQGFTIVELLIVIVVIGVLAAITIVAYNGVQQRAREVAIKSELSGVARLMALDKAITDAYALTAAAVNDGKGLPVSNSSVTYQYRSTGTTYCVTGTKGTTSYKISDVAPSPSPGGCAGDGVGGVDAVTNLATNPSVESGGTGWSARWYGSGGAGTTTITSAAALYGDRGYRKTWTTGGGGQDIGFQYNQPTITAGTTYTFSAHVRASVVTEHRASIIWQDASGATLSSINSVAVSISANTWQRLSTSGVAPANSVKAAFVWGPYPPGGAPNSIAGQTVDFDGVMITESPTLATYADGSSPNWIWNGGPNASTSSGPSL